MNTETVAAANPMMEAPKIHNADILARMKRVTYVTRHIEGTTTTFVDAFLDGQFLIATGMSACISPRIFDAELGVTMAREKAQRQATDKLWELEGYRLFCALQNDQVPL